ncbi:MAG TPA: hypothetical protein VL737_00610 [Candidatus Pristimantibacillus sp.]|jgi:hypothetical protein|nr:hypothetical protein [Candidatus Pristimantibacillus sp.]
MPSLFLPSPEAPGATALLERPEQSAIDQLTFEQDALLNILTEESFPVESFGEERQVAPVADYTGRVIGGISLDGTKPQPEQTGPQAAFQGEDSRETFAGALERGVDAAGIVRRAASRFLMPFVDALRGDPTLRGRVDSLLYNGTESDPLKPKRFTLDIDSLREQRGLGREEREYLQVVSDITEVNPFLVAAGAVEPSIAHAVLRCEYDRRSLSTRRAIPSGSSVPLVVAGAGIHGTIAGGSILTERPDILEDALFFDRAATPGGVFDRANGEAHLVNSANYVGDEPFVLPPRVTDGTIRLEAGLFPQSPGERTNPDGGRTGSINRLVPFFPSPDEYERAKRYVSNWTFALASKLQNTLLMRRFRGETELRSIELAGDGSADTYRVITQDLQSNEQFEVTTNNVLLPTGLGKPRRVIRDDEYFQELLRVQEAEGTDRFPLYCDAVEAYNYFADVTRGPVRSGRRFAIIGSGDSAATLIEALAGLYKVGNLGEVDKITVVASSSLSERCRYSSISDALERFEAATGRKNLLEVVDSRVESLLLRFDPLDRSISDGNAINLVDAAGNVISGSAGGPPVEVDHVIEATGFESELEQILRPLLGGKRLQDSLSDITARSNPFVAVGQMLADNPGIAIVGTAAVPKFTPDKQAELPAGTQEVLNAVSENVVAIGLRGTDTTIATKQWLRMRRDQLPTYVPPTGEADQAPISPDKPMRDTFSVALDANLPPVDRTLEPNAALLTPLLLLPLAARGLASRNDVDPSVPLVVEADDQIAAFRVMPVEKRQYRARITFSDSAVGVTPVGDMPVELTRELALAAQDPHFQSYGMDAMRRRRSDSITVTLNYNGEQLSLQDSLVQAS